MAFGSFEFDTIDAPLPAARVFLYGDLCSLPSLTPWSLPTPISAASFHFFRDLLGSIDCTMASVSANAILSVVCPPRQSLQVELVSGSSFPDLNPFLYLLPFSTVFRWIFLSYMLCVQLWSAYIYCVWFCAPDCCLWKCFIFCCFRIRWLYIVYSDQGHRSIWRPSFKWKLFCLHVFFCAL